MKSEKKKCVYVRKREKDWESKIDRERERETA